MNKMINIISNANPTVTITVGTEQTGLYTKKVNLSYENAEDLFIYMQLRPVNEKVDDEYFKKLLTYLGNTEVFLQSSREVNIMFDESFIRYMKEKHPNRDYQNYFLEIHSSNNTDPYWDIEPED